MRRPLVLLAALAGCAAPPPARPDAPPAPVTVAPARKKSVPVQIRAIGSVKSLSTVAVRPRVGGQLTEVLFREGADVAKGQKLFQIDPRPFDAAVKQAEANLARDAALLAGARQELARVERLGGAVSGAELDVARTAVASAEAVAAATAAAVNSAKLQAGFATITSPLDGRAGELLVTQGNLLDASGVGALVVINQVSPIAVTFALPEPQLPAVAAARRKGPLKAEAYLRDGAPPAPGVLAFVDNAVNTGSGTVQLKAEFPNADRALWPGQFVDVVLTVGDRADSVVVPAAAVQAGQQGAFVFVVTADNKAELKPVTVAFEAGGEAVIASGLAGGESVVVDGQLRLISGTKVDVKSGPGAPPPAPTPAPSPAAPAPAPTTPPTGNKP